MDLFLQLFLLLNLFILGVVVTIAVRHAYAHFVPQKHEIEKPHPAATATHLPPAIKEQMLANAQADFQKALTHNAAELQKELTDTITKLNAMLSKLGEQVIGNEMERFHKQLEAMESQVDTTLATAKTEITDHHETLKSKLNEQMEAEKQQLVAQMDTKLADAIASFLTETLQHNVDLGAQSTYLTSMLEEHKAELIGEVADETEAAS